MKSTVYIFSIILVLFLNGCTQLPQHEKQPIAESQQLIIIKAHDTVQNGDSTPVSFLLTPPMQPGEVLVLRHKQNEFARVTLEGQIKLQQISLRIRAMGSGDIVAFLHKKDGQEVGWKKHITVNDYSPIPEFNTFPLRKRERIENNALKMIVMNSSAKEKYVEEVSIDFGSGKIIIHGSQYFSEHPYFAVYPEVFPGKPEVDVKLAP